MLFWPVCFTYCRLLTVGDTSIHCSSLFTLSCVRQRLWYTVIHCSSLFRLFCVRQRLWHTVIHCSLLFRLFCVRQRLWHTVIHDSSLFRLGCVRHCHTLQFLAQTRLHETTPLTVLHTVLHYSSLFGEGCVRQHLWRSSTLSYITVHCSEKAAWDKTFVTQREIRPSEHHGE